jgi:GntR family transcriptional repressor for pyruvate dehydrogenase complex
METSKVSPHNIRVKSIKKRALPEQIISEIKSLIDSGQLTYGSRLPSEREFAQMLGVGRPTLREALKALKVLGIVHNRHGAGNFLTKELDDWPIEPLSVFFSIKKGALIELYEARKGLEISAVSLSAVRRSEVDLKVIQSTVEKMRNALDDYNRFYNHDTEFHRAIVASTQNSIIIDLMEKIYRLCIETRKILWETAGTYEIYPTHDLEKHEELLAYIEQKDSEAAVRCVSSHMDEIIQRYKKGLNYEKR